MGRGGKVKEPVAKSASQRRASTSSKPSPRGASPAGTVNTKTAADNCDQTINVAEDPAQIIKCPPADSDDSDVVDPKKSCPCGRSTGEYKLDCSQCQQFWHFGCVGLKGLTKGQSNKLAEYKCPFCYVAPVRTTLDTSDCCLTCRNTRVLRDANQTLEGAQLAEKIQSFKALSETLASVDFDSLNKNLKAMQNLDTRLLHLLLKSDDLEDHQKHLEKVESAVNQISMTMSSPQPSSATPVALASIENRLTELQDQVTKLSSHQPPPSTPSVTPAVLESIENRLGDLQDQVSKLPTHQAVLDHQQQQQQQQQQRHPPEPAVEFTPELITDHGFKHIEDQQENFIDSAMGAQLNSFIDGCEFVVEGGHSVCMYGYPYKYAGSRSSSRVPPIPDAIKGVMEKVNEICTQKGLPLVNSCLINKYEGETAFLPQHCDDEASLHPESSIFTVSLGQECEVIFTDKQNTERRVTCTDRSMYEMSCKSQGFYMHRIDQGAFTGEGKRYSLTFRTLDWKNKHSTCIIGDSNSCLLKFGANKKTTFGELMPGKQVYSPLLGDIDPTVACAYQNVVVMCGINDVRKPEVDSEGVKSAYTKLKTCIYQIRDLNKSANVFVCPLLPTKLADVNRKAIMFNELISQDLVSSSLGVTLVRGFDDFLDNSGLLDRGLSKAVDRYNKPDKLHLNWKGAAMLAGMVKSSIFLRINGGVDKRPARKVNGRPYSTVAARGTMAGTRYS